MGNDAWYVYMIKCVDNSYYTGITVDVERRFSRHCSGKGAKYTRGRAPLELVYKEFCGNHSEALRREIEIKKLTHNEKVLLAQKNLIDK